MSGKHVTHLLSAYIDGEASAPERIARHLQGCPECARQRLALLKLSAAVQALPAPAADVGFTQQVLGKAADAPPERRFLQLAYVMPAMVAAVGLLIIGAGLLYVAEITAPPAPETAPQPVTIQTPAPVPAPAPERPSAMERLVRLYVAHPDLEPPHTLQTPPTQIEDISMESLARWAAAHDAPDDRALAKQDPFAALNNLNAQERAVLAVLLQESQNREE